MRHSLLTCCIVLAIAASVRVQPVHAQAARLPDIGSSAGEIIGPEEERQYGAYTLYQLRRMNLVVEDPLLHEWLTAMGKRIGAASDKPQQEFTFFLLNERGINAFATLGGYIGMNAGLILNASREDEVAGVLAHEVAHVTQRHLLRGEERARKDQIPLMLASLGALIATQSAGARGNSSNPGDSSSDNAAAAVIVGAQALAQQRRIDYTRSNEAEADRIGLQTLNRAGYDVQAMGDFFEVLQRLSRGNTSIYATPDYLRTHPVTLTRISEAREGARRLAEEPRLRANPNALPNSPLLPRGLSPRSDFKSPSDGLGFRLSRERLRVLTARTPAEALDEYEKLRKQKALDDAQIYGLAVAHLRKAQPAAAEVVLQRLSPQAAEHQWARIALGESLLRQGKTEAGNRVFDALLAAHPDDRAVRLSLARIWVESEDKASGQRAQALLRPLASKTGDDPIFHQTFARASELAGDVNRAAEAYAEHAYYTGRPEDALTQLRELLKRKDLDYVQRARVESSIAILTPIVLEMRKQGMRPENQDAPRYGGAWSAEIGKH